MAAEIPDRAREGKKKRQSRRSFGVASGTVSFRQSPQCVRKNFFSVGSNASDLPTNGRNAVVICSATRMKMTTQTFRPVVERACEWENPACRKRNPNVVAIIQKA